MQVSIDSRMYCHFLTSSFIHTLLDVYHRHELRISRMNLKTVFTATFNTHYAMKRLQGVSVTAAK